MFLFRFLFFLVFFWLMSLSAFAFKVDKVSLFRVSSGNYLLSLQFRDFPTQEVLLALKRQKGEVLILYEFEFYRERFLKDERISREVYYQRAGYIPEKNQYFFEDNFHRSLFNQPEDLLPTLTYLQSYPLKGPSPERGLYLFIHITLKYRTHLNEDLRFTPKEREVILKTSMKYDKL